MQSQVADNLVMHVFRVDYYLNDTITIRKYKKGARINNGQTE